MPQKATQTGTSNDTKTLVTVLLLIFVYPIGVIVMMLWTSWKLWVKLLVAAPIVLLIIGLLAALLLGLANPGGNKGGRRAECMTSCQQTNDTATCIKMCSTVQ